MVMSLQTNLQDFITVLEQKKKERERKEYEDISTRLTPYNIESLVKREIIHKDDAIFVLYTLFYELEDNMNNYNKKADIIDLYARLSNKNKDLRALLENIFITEFSHKIRFKALFYLSKYFPKKAHQVFVYECERDGFVNYILENYSIEELLPLRNAINDPFLHFYISFREELKSIYRISFKEKKLSRVLNSQKSYIQFNSEINLKRYTLIKKYSTEEILKLPLMSFVKELVKQEKGYKWVWLIDKKERDPNIIFISEKRDDRGAVSYTHLTLPTTPYV